MDKIRKEIQSYYNAPNKSKIIAHNITNQKNIFKTCEN